MVRYSAVVLHYVVFRSFVTELLAVDVAICHTNVIMRQAILSGMEVKIMAVRARANARLNVRLDPELKRMIEEAASRLGQSMSDYAVSTLIRDARVVIQETEVTRLSNRDRDRFLAILDAKAKPNRALVRAAKRYKKHLA